MPLDAPYHHHHAEQIGIVDRMRNSLLTNGWCQRKFEDGDRRCFLGALYDAVGYSPTFDRVANSIVIAAFDILEGQHAQLWQDKPGRTVFEVLDLLDHVRDHFETAPSA
ncbi:MAG TPA: hypothetical protein VIO57_10180 [Chloroflexota bacterium]|jgi:hypothetical protein